MSNGQVEINEVRAGKPLQMVGAAKKENEGPKWSAL